MLAVLLSFLFAWALGHLSENSLKSEANSLVKKFAFFGLFFKRVTLNITEGYFET